MLDRSLWSLAVPIARAKGHPHTSRYAQIPGCGAHLARAIASSNADSTRSWLERSFNFSIFENPRSLATASSRRLAAISGSGGCMNLAA